MNHEPTDLFGVLEPIVGSGENRAGREIRSRPETPVGIGKSTTETVIPYPSKTQSSRPENHSEDVLPGTVGEIPMSHSDPLLRELSGIRVALNRIADHLEQDAPKKSKPRKTDTGYTNDFEKFWWNYPRKVKKPAAFTAWKKLTDNQKVQALKVIPLWAKAWKATDTRYIPHASSWLNSLSFEDKLDQAVPDQKEDLSKLKDNELLDRCKARGINTVGLSRFELIDRLGTS